MKPRDNFNPYDLNDVAKKIRQMEANRVKIIYRPRRDNQGNVFPYEPPERILIKPCKK